jgi:hypothetical protein
VDPVTLLAWPNTRTVQGIQGTAAANLSPGSRALEAAMRCADEHGKRAVRSWCAVQYPGLSASPWSLWDAVAIGAWAKITQAKRQG